MIVMIFVTITPQQAAQYSYMCTRLKTMINKMGTARKTLEGVANTSFDKPFAKCVYLLTSESLQCENEIRAQIDSLSCHAFENRKFENKGLKQNTSINGLESLCNYCEKIYLGSYKKLLNDKQLSSSLKNLIQKQLQLFMSSLTQLRLLQDVETVLN